MPAATASKKFVCTICNKQYKSERTLRKHTQTHGTLGIYNPKHKIILWKTFFFKPSLTLIPCWFHKYRKCGLTIFFFKNIESETTASGDNGASNSAMVFLRNVSTEEASLSSEVEYDIPDDDELIESGNVESYFFEDDDELEEHIRELEVLGHEFSRGEDLQPKGLKKPLIKCNKCAGSYDSIQTYLRHKETHSMSGKFYSFLVMRFSANI